MTMKLYHCAETRSMRTLWLLHELDLPFELVDMPFDHKVLRAKEYLGVSPLGRVPAFVDGDMTLIESGAIAEYLCEIYDKDNAFGRPFGHAERYDWLKWIHFAETLIIPCQNMVQQHMFIPPEQKSEIVIYFETRRLGKCLDAMEKILQGQEYLLPSGFSAADTCVGFSIYFSSAFVTHDEHPSVKAYFDRIMARPAFKKSMPPNQSIPMEWLRPKIGALLNPNTGKPVEG
jgi:glutathione S-transferase